LIYGIFQRIKLTNYNTMHPEVPLDLDLNKMMIIAFAHCMIIILCAFDNDILFVFCNIK
jgi:hypothetical protein